MIALPPPGYEQTIEAIAQCGIARENISIAYTDLLQSDEITIGDLGALSHRKLACLRDAVHPFYILTIENQSQQNKFYEFSSQSDRARTQTAAREWLKSKGLLDRLPVFDDRQSVDLVAVKLERACWLVPGSALKAYGTSAITLHPEYLIASGWNKSSGTVDCLIQMFEASNATERGINLAIIGDEASIEEQI